MSELELQLRALGSELAVPPAPDLAAAVASRIRRRTGRRRALLAVAIAAAAIGVAFAVPPARSAILRFFHLEGVTVERVDTLPAGPARSLGKSLGEPMSLAAAEQRLGFRFLLPAGASPTRARVVGRLGTVLLAHGGAPLLLSEYRGQVFEVMKKVVGPSTTVAEVDVDHVPGIWVEGATHFLYFGRTGAVSELPIVVHGNVLFWQHDGVICRLQGRIGLREAIRIAESTR